MNCKPEDLAIITGASKNYAGVVVKVVRLAPGVRFQLPDGQMHQGVCAECWVIQTPRKFSFPTASGIVRLSCWAVIDDYKLRPVSGLPLTEKQLDEVTA